LILHKLDRELDVAVRLAREAGEAIMGYYQTGSTVEHKAGDEPVTIADRVSDAHIRSALRAAYPEDGLLTEEAEDDLARLAKERVWIVDPLDGTTEFISGTGDFAVQIALVVGGQPVLGVVYQPVTDAIYYAVRGQGAYQMRNGEAIRLHVSAQTEPAKMCLVASRSHYSPFIDSARRKLGIDSVTRAGSVGIKVGLLVRGICDLYLATKISKEWDVCAPHALLLESGGVLTNLCGEVPVYNKAKPIACKGLIASNGRAHWPIVEALAPLRQGAEE
jgi:3'(2'),5'-bisphosphate nucleotidase